MLGGDGVLQLLVVDDPPLLQVDEEHLPRLQPPLGDDLLGRDVEDAGLGAHDDEVVPGHAVPRRPQAVPVEHGADGLAVGEADRRGAVPGLHEGGVIGVKILFLPAHRHMSLPRLGDEHHHRPRQAEAGADEQFDGVIQARRVAQALPDDRQQLLDVPRLELVARRTAPGGRASS